MKKRDRLRKKHAKMVINEFIANKHVINIQFKINNYPDYFAFVTYEDK